MLTHVVLTSNHSPWSRYSGEGQKSIHMLAMAFASLGLRVDVVYTRTPWEQVEAPEEMPYQVHWSLFAAIRPSPTSPFRFLNAYWMLRKVRKLVSAETLLIGNGAEACLLHRISPRGALVHISRHPHYEAWLAGSNWRSPLTWFLVFQRNPCYAAMAWAMLRADRVGFSNPYTLYEGTAIFPFAAGKTFVLRDGIHSAILDAPLPTEMGRDILFFGRLTRAKGVDTLLEAYAKLAADLRQEHALRIVGDGPAMDELKTQASALALGDGGRVDFAGWHSGDELVQDIRSAAVIALPSREETHGTTMLEALALGRPLVTTRVGHIPQMLGELADLFEAGDAYSLAAMVTMQLRADFDPALAESRRKWVSERYSWAAQASKMLDS